ncbi:cbb3-type cytochrome oxidase subunit 3 [Spartinivicinus poritis]|uniref:Cbb3-type cytochrome c oxidase subunit 3 n=1 Tax=Spartinivicinus poritis TaxID=2994640 RepID=A0ABT5UEN1_9GAMM|nr:cbb3-type cytochrome c oxidase subunit 3 [Spartinivicinus sp. A2-2]MDE1463933.1 cbb3-type cytochrome c oxidase subunit 3 [Spartinivicinus sp. A2-2]
MDINTFRGLATIFAMVAFVGICLWAYSYRRKKDFDEAANLPFADEPEKKQGNTQEINRDRD